MTQNMGPTDRTLRLAAAAGMAALIATGRVRGTAAVVLGALATVFATTSAAGHCPAYVPLDLDTHA